jgi:hypothetical protein
MQKSLNTDKEIFERFLRHENLRKLRTLLDGALGKPLWWVSFRLNGSSKTLADAIQASHEIWRDPRLQHFRYTQPLYEALKKRSKERCPFWAQAPQGQYHFCLPLVFEERVIGYLGLSHFHKKTHPQTLHLLSSSAALIFDNCLKAQELHRLSATIRPRAVALSTVHTVHRIINSTLNLDELISRLAHLTAQVVRANRCAIYLLEEACGKGPKALICKALVGYSKHANKKNRVLFGKEIEGKVAKTAQTILRKKLLCVPLIDEDVIGVVLVSSKKDKKEFAYFDQEILTTLAEEAVIAIKNAQLYEEQKKVTLGTIQSLALILGTRIPDSSSPEIFLNLALKVADELCLRQEEVQALHYATLLKDTAKVGIPEEILKKPAKLTGEEYAILRQQPIRGAKIVQSFENLKPVVPIILYSRERYDGTGYPEGLKGDKIPIGARILSVINTLEALVMGRPYHHRLSFKEAVGEIAKNSGSQFDPRVVDAFLKAVKKEDFERSLGKIRRA